MEPHPVPRQITSFEFKLIGFLTLRQFIYIAIFSAIGVIFFYGIPIPFINIVATVISVLIGLACAFIPFNERPLDVFIINFIKKLTLPTQYYYQKKNITIPFSTNSSASDDVVQNHIIARQKLADYLNKKNNNAPNTDSKKQEIRKIFSDKEKPLIPLKKPALKTPVDQQMNTPFLSGTIKNNKEVPIPEILIYIKNKEGQLSRILKTNVHGHFATFHPLSGGEYSLLIKDPKGVFFFDALTLSITENSPQILTITSKELL